MMVKVWPDSCASLNQCLQMSLGDATGANQFCNYFTDCGLDCSFASGARQQQSSRAAQDRDADGVRTGSNVP
jgi:hypothetical protein